MKVKEFFKQAKLGDLVDLRDDLKINHAYGTDTYVGGMPAPGTKGLKIVHLYVDSCRFRAKDVVYNFTPEMVKCVYSVDSKQKSETGEKNVSSIKVGDVVRFRSDLVEKGHIPGTNLTFFPEGPVKPGCEATVEEVVSHSDVPTIFRVQGSSYYYDSGMLVKNVTGEKSDAPYVVKETIVKSVLDRVADREKIFEFLDQKLGEGCVIKIRENVHRTARYWGCCYLSDSMMESGRTAKISGTMLCDEDVHGNRFYLDKDKSGYVYTVPMFDMVYCITRNPFIYKEFLETFDVDEVTENKPECKIPAELIRESIEKLQELEKALSKYM